MSDHCDTDDTYLPIDGGYPLFVPSSPYYSSTPPIMPSPKRRRVAPSQPPKSTLGKRGNNSPGMPPSKRVRVVAGYPTSSSSQDLSNPDVHIPSSPYRGSPDLLTWKNEEPSSSDLDIFVVCKPRSLSPTHVVSLPRSPSPTPVVPLPDSSPSASGIYSTSSISPRDQGSPSGEYRTSDYPSSSLSPSGVRPTCGGGKGGKSFAGTISNPSRSPSPYCDLFIIPLSPSQVDLPSEDSEDCSLNSST